MHPTLFTIPGLDVPVQSWGFLVAAGLIVGWVMSLRFARADQLPADSLGTAYVLAAGFALLGARVLWVAQRPGADDGGWISYVQIQAGGMAIGGGLILALVVTFLWAQTRKVPFYAWADCMAPALLLGATLERIGAFLAGAEFGVLADADFALAIHYPVDSPVYDYQRAIMQGMTFPPGQSLPVHPSQLYAAGILALGFVALLALRRRRRFSGQSMLLGLAIYVVARMAVEDAFVVGGSPVLVGFVTTGMVSALVLGGIAGITYALRTRRAATEPAQVQQWKGGPWTPGWVAPKAPPDGKASAKASARGLGGGPKEKK